MGACSGDSFREDPGSPVTRNFDCMPRDVQGQRIQTDSVRPARSERPEIRIHDLASQSSHPTLPRPQHRRRDHRSSVYSQQFVHEESYATVHEMTNQAVNPTAECIQPEFVDGQYRLLATRDFQIGDHILRLVGEIVETPSKYSVQLGPGQHMDLPAEIRSEPPVDRYRWRFLNHSCEPNAEFDDINLVAAREIKASQEITFDYNTTEYDLAVPFECHCGADSCCGLVRGRRWRENRAEA